MFYLRHAVTVVLSAMLLAPLSSKATEEVGQAVLIKTEVTGAGGPLAVDDPVHRDEQIRTSISGLGQFTFRDGTRLAVGAGSSVTIDKFVFDDSGTVKKLTINAAKGSFRWMSGNSNHSAYQIVTPAGTIGVRGTAFDFYVGANGTTAVVLLNGAAQFCGAGGCRQLKQQCDCVVAKRNGQISEPRRVNRDVLKRLGNQRALPFLSGDQQLSGRMGFVGGGGCGLSAAMRDRPNGISPRNAPANNPAPAPHDMPSAPNLQGSPHAEAPAAPHETPSTPDVSNPPSAPDKSGKPHEHDDDEGEHHNHHEHHGHHGRGDHGWDDHQGDDQDSQGNRDHHGGGDRHR
ncbi:FecR domain-containing protein [Rhizobium sp. CNPSo 4039]|uniref:FecR family protein n=1 Tax=Rhizobium sp. CNPSo 4039 TaxID=3021409 RepID=UPI00254D53C8|nr:FecR domain-containing protein [Rhizobium sp. CNPSo 4039]MDK4717657.1 FecR domain-containing protein [Rhizobium sp. CNPSo 4039]